MFNTAKQRIFLGTTAAAIALAGATATSVSAQNSAVDYAAVAQRVVNESAGVRPGEVVVINGSPTELELLEQLQAAVLLAGGQPIVTISFPRANRRAIAEVPLDYLRQEPRADLALIAAGDVFITAGGVQDPTLFADVPEERFTISREANLATTRALAAKRARSVDIGQTGGIPTEAYARSQNADPTAMRQMFFRALTVPTNVIAERGAAVSRRMAAGQQVRVRSAAGTDVRFRLADGRSRVSTGRAADNDTGTGMAQAFLPAGDFYACVQPNSADGVVVVPFQTFRGRPVRNMRLTFSQGALTAATAEVGGEMINTYLATLDADSKQLSLINIGLNPESRPLQGADYLSWEMSGVPTLLTGNSQWAGCTNAAAGGFSVHQVGATVTAGDAEVIRAGELAIN